MTLAILLYGLAAGALAALVGWALAIVFRMAGQPERWAWLGATVAAVGAALVPFVPLGAAAMDVSPAGVFRVSEVGDGVAATGTVPGRRAWLSGLSLDHHLPGAGVAWLALSSVLLTFGLGAEFRHRRRTGALRRTRLRGMEVWMSQDEGPAICGALRPRLVLPERIRELDGRERALVLTHEAEHLRARDPQLNALAFLAVVVVPWNPFVWLLRGRLARALESDCDRRALRRRGVGARSYADLLLRIASWRLTPPPVPLRLAMSHSARELRRRLERLLEPKPPRRSGAFAGLLLLGAGMTVPVFADPPDPPRTVELAGGGAGALSERPTGGTLYRAAEVSEALTLGGPPAIDHAGFGQGAFALQVATDGGVEAVVTEAIEGGADFEVAARRWLLTARVEPDATPDPVRVWVSMDAEGRWAAVRVADALWAREGLESDPGRALELIDVWRRLEAARGLGLPTVSSTLSRLDSAPVASASFRDGR